MFPPLLSEADPKETSEGSLDPLGLYPLADDLALKLAPGVRERQKHPRFLTSIAVSLAVCREFGDDRTAKDGTSEPWLVFEWLLTEGLVRQASAEDLVGLPGSQKVWQAIQRDGVRISAKNYLKTPSVFGFHGVYRLLAKTVGIERGGQLWEQGAELLRIWSEEQGLPGFYGTGGGEGANCLRVFRDAVEQGLQKGYIDQGPGWLGWKYFARHLSVYGVGKREEKYIRSLVATAGDGHRREVFDFLTSKVGRKTWLAADDSERAFHAAMLPHAETDLQDLLRAIDDYETFARRMHDAFEDCLHEMSVRRVRTSTADLAGLAGVVRAAKEVPAVFSRLRDRLGIIDASKKFVEQFGEFAEPLSPAEFAERLIVRHQVNQRRKPPHGKAPWFDRFDDGACIIRTGYLRDEGGTGGDEYVHAYRTRSLWIFAEDLHLV